MTHLLEVGAYSGLGVMVQFLLEDAAYLRPGAYWRKANTVSKSSYAKLESWNNLGEKSKLHYQRNYLHKVVVNVEKILDNPF